MHDNKYVLSIIVWKDLKIKKQCHKFLSRKNTAHEPMNEIASIIRKQTYYSTTEFIKILLIGAERNKSHFTPITLLPIGVSRWADRTHHIGMHWQSALRYKGALHHLPTASRTQNRRTCRPISALGRVI